MYNGVDVGDDHKPFLSFMCFAIVAKPSFVDGQTFSFI
jgi:hypothetical protein